MAVDDPVVLVFDDRYAEPWALLRGGETFYDRDNPDPKQRDLMRRWQSPRAAIAWARDNLGVEVVLNEELVKMNDDLIAAYDEQTACAEAAEAEAKRARADLENRPTQTSFLES